MIKREKEKQQKMITTFSRKPFFERTICAWDSHGAKKHTQSKKHKYEYRYGIGDTDPGYAILNIKN